MIFVIKDLNRTDNWSDGSQNTAKTLDRQKDWQSRLRLVCRTCYKYQNLKNRSYFLLSSSTWHSSSAVFSLFPFSIFYYFGGLSNQSCRTRSTTSSRRPTPELQRLSHSRLVPSARTDTSSSKTVLARFLSLSLIYFLRSAGFILFLDLYIHECKFRFFTLILSLVYSYDDFVFVWDLCFRDRFWLDLIRSLYVVSVNVIVLF